jgi:hypothetical protein
MVTMEKQGSCGSMNEKYESGEQINFEAVANFARFLQTTDAPEPLQKLAEAYVALYTKWKPTPSTVGDVIRQKAACPDCFGRGWVDCKNEVHCAQSSVRSETGADPAA